MKTIIISCSMIACIGAVLKLILNSSGRELISKAVSNTTFIIFLLTFVKFVFSRELPQLSFEVSKDEYDQISKSVFVDTIESAESEIEEKIIVELNNEFNIFHIECNIKIDSDTLGIISAEIILDRSEIFISTYEIINHIKDKFEIDAEVYFS